MIQNNVFTDGDDILVSMSNDNKRDNLNEMKVEFQKAVKEDETLLSKLYTLSNNIEVVNTLGFGDNGNIFVDRTKKSTSNERHLLPTSTIVGYKIANNGDVPINYVTEEWEYDDVTEKYVGKVVNRVLEPGGTAMLTRQYFTMLCCIPEISFELANGKVIKGSGKKDGADIKDVLESYYFKFKKDSSGVVKTVNSDTVKLNVGRKVAGEWQVKENYIKTFGYLNNPKEDKKRSGNTVSASAVAANYVKSMIEKGNM